MSQTHVPISPEVLCKIKEIEIYTRRLLSGGFIGSSRSSVKGAGLEFEQMRDYLPGDDVRYIDWNVSSRLDRMVVREYIEEKDKTILLAVDLSHSMFFGSPSRQMKSENVQQLASVLALVASYMQDKVGLILFSDTVECFVPPKRGASHVRYLIQKIFSHQTMHASTSINVACDFIAHLKIKNAIVFLISDFLDEKPFLALRIIAKKHDVISIVCSDAYETKLPSVGFLSVVDPESRQEAVLDLRNKGARSITMFLQETSKTRHKKLRLSGSSIIEITSDRPFIHEIIKFFCRRIHI